MKNVFNANDAQELNNRVNQLTNTTPSKWGKMDVAQMLAHCNKPYEMVFEPEKFKKPGAITKWLMKTFLKEMVVGPKPYKKNSKTAPGFIISDKKEFTTEKEHLQNYITKIQALGEDHFNGKESHSLGKLTSSEWNAMFYKHLNHHLEQFGV